VSNSEYLSIYIHIPFCRTRCFYCDFNTTTGTGHLIDPFIEALKTEMELVSSRLANKPIVHTLFFGGGTPSVLPAEKIVSVIDQVKRCFRMIDDPEISMEMNPVQMTENYLQEVKEGGVNRISFGMQSASLEELRMLGRKHNFKDVIESITLARGAGIDNLNLDIIFGLPSQSISSFSRTLEAAVQIHPPHLSLYALTVEDDTPLAAMIDRGELSAPDPDTAGEMFETAMERLAEAGYSQYEISNWAIDEAHQCRHNLQYWKNGLYLGFGAGAHSHYGQWRWENAEPLLDYIYRVLNPTNEMNSLSPAASKQTELTFNDNLGETMMMGLRLTDDGISENEFSRRFGVSLEETYLHEIDTSIRQQLLEWTERDDGRHLRLTHMGRMLGNQVFMRFLKD
jgi:oxygen-independent coproporphyrinogen-3 oxidase